MPLFPTQKELSAFLRVRATPTVAVGLVPTMGALHQGHLGLVERALAENDVVVVSIFVNPTQFNNSNDLEQYPKTLDADMALLYALHQDIVIFAPTVQDIYPHGASSDKFDFDGLERAMEGAFRPGHFNGVGTIVKRLFDLVKPSRAYFGEKDFQQLQIIRKLNEKLAMGIDIIGCPIFREPDGLAMSSRNVRLTKPLRNAAPFIYQTLQKAKKKFGTEDAYTVMEWVENQFQNHPLLNLEYVSIAEEQSLKPVFIKESGKKYRVFVAVFAEDVRLIDNMALN